jgi:hypothetical protein
MKGIKGLKPEITDYLLKVSALLEKSTDIFAHIFKIEIFSEITDLANKNFDNCGDPILTEEQLTGIYNEVISEECSKSIQKINNVALFLN